MFRKKKSEPVQIPEFDVNTYDEDAYEKPDVRKGDIVVFAAGGLKASPDGDTFNTRLSYAAEIVDPGKKGDFSDAVVKFEKGGPVRLAEIDSHPFAYGMARNGKYSEFDDRIWAPAEAEDAMRINMQTAAKFIKDKQTGYRYEDIRVPAVCVHGPFTSDKNGQQYDVVSVPLEHNRWGTMSVAEKQLERNDSSITMHLPADRQRSIRIKEKDYSDVETFEHLYPEEIRTKFDDYAKHSVKRNEKGIARMKECYDDQVKADRKSEAYWEAGE